MVKIPKLANAVGHIDDDLVIAAGNRKTKANLRVKWGAFAACFAVLAIATAVMLPLFQKNTPDIDEERYKRYTYSENTGAIAWRWEDRTPSERYTEVEVEGIAYRIQGGRTVGEQWIGSKLGTYPFVGYDMISSEEHTAEFDIYEVKGLQKEQYIAVEMEGRFYVFFRRDYNPPPTLGELLSNVALPKFVELRRFSKNGDGTNAEHFTLKDDDYIWDVLVACADAPFVEDDWWMANDREYLSFTVTSEALGIYKHAMYVTEDGYLWTNAFNYQYLFNIGKEAAGRVMTYAAEHAETASYEPYENTLVGTLTEIADEYLVIDDTVLCKDPREGMTYTVLLDDLRIARYVKHDLIRVGQTVRVSYDGEIEKENVIRGAYFISDIRLCFEEDEQDAILETEEDTAETVTATTKKSAYRPPKEE